MTTLVMSFGRFQGPHIGHGLVFDKCRSLAEETSGDYVIYPSLTENKDNPIPFDVKIDLLRQMFPEHSSHIQRPSSNVLAKILAEMTGRYSDLVFVCGDDRVESFRTFIEGYNGKDFTFETVKVVSSGPRCELNVTDITGASASRVRAAVRNKNFVEYCSMIPTDIPPIIAADMFVRLSEFLHDSE